MLVKFYYRLKDSNPSASRSASARYSDAGLHVGCGGLHVGRADCVGTSTINPLLGTRTANMLSSVSTLRLIFMAVPPLCLYRVQFA